MIFCQRETDIIRIGFKLIQNSSRYTSLFRAAAITRALIYLIFFITLNVSRTITATQQVVQVCVCERLPILYAASRFYR